MSHLEPSDGTYDKITDKEEQSETQKLDLIIVKLKQVRDQRRLQKTTTHTKPHSPAGVGQFSSCPKRVSGWSAHPRSLGPDEAACPDLVPPPTLANGEKQQWLKEHVNSTQAFGTALNQLQVFQGLDDPKNILHRVDLDVLIWALEDLNQLIGMNQPDGPCDQFAELLMLIFLENGNMLGHMMHFMGLGPPGVGKTTFFEKMAVCINALGLLGRSKKQDKPSNAASAEAGSLSPKRTSAGRDARGGAESKTSEMSDVERLNFLTCWAVQQQMEAGQLRTREMNLLVKVLLTDLDHLDEGLRLIEQYNQEVQRFLINERWIPYPPLHQRQTLAGWQGAGGLDGVPQAMPPPHGTHPAVNLQEEPWHSFCDAHKPCKFEQLRWQMESMSKVRQGLGERLSNLRAYLHAHRPNTELLSSQTLNLDAADLPGPARPASTGSNTHDTSSARSSNKRPAASDVDGYGQRPSKMPKPQRTAPEPRPKVPVRGATSTSLEEEASNVADGSADDSSQDRFRALAKYSSYKPSRAETHAGYQGQTAIKVSELVNAHRGKMLIFDEAQNLVNGAQDSYGFEALRVLMKFMSEEPDDLMFAFLGPENEVCSMLEHIEGLSRRLFRIEFPRYTHEDLARIFEYQATRREGWTIDPQLDLVSFFRSNFSAFPNYGGDTERFLFQCKMGFANDNWTNIFTKQVGTDPTGKTVTAGTEASPPSASKILTEHYLQEGFKRYQKRAEQTAKGRAHGQANAQNPLPEHIQSLYI